MLNIYKSLPHTGDLQTKAFQVHFLKHKEIVESLDSEVNGMRKWLDIVERIVPIVISYQINNIYKRNVS